VICPWELYLAYGDKGLLQEHLPMMQRWVDYLRCHVMDREEYLTLQAAAREREAELAETSAADETVVDPTQEVTEP